MEPTGRPGSEDTAVRVRDPEVVGRRVLACLLDCLLVLAACSAVLWPLFPGFGNPLGSLYWMLALLVLFCAVYTVYVAPMDGLWGGTLGKRAVGIEVVTAAEGSRPGLARATLRALTFLATDGLLGLFVVLSSPTRQRPGDLVTGTMVVRREPR